MSYIGQILRTMHGSNYLFFGLILQSSCKMALQVNTFQAKFQ